MEKVLIFITPGPLTERFYFSGRVLVSWLTSYSFIGLGLTFWLASIPTSAKTIANSGSLTTAFAFALAMCFYASIALGIDAYLGRKPAHYGWYWWVYPIISCAWVPIIVILLILGVAGKSSSSHPPKFDPDQFRQEVENTTVENIIQKFDDKFEQANIKNQLNSGEKEVIQKIKDLARSRLGTRLKDKLSKKELNILFELILRILSGELG